MFNRDKHLLFAEQKWDEVKLGPTEDPKAAYER